MAKYRLNILFVNCIHIWILDEKHIVQEKKVIWYLFMNNGNVIKKLFFIFLFFFNYFYYMTLYKYLKELIFIIYVNYIYSFGLKKNGIIHNF